MKKVLKFIKSLFSSKDSYKDYNSIESDFIEWEDKEEEDYVCYNCGHDLREVGSMITPDIIINNNDAKSFGHCGACQYVTTFINGIPTKSKDTKEEVALARTMFNKIGKSPTGYSYVSGGHVYDFEEDVDYDVENGTVDTCDEYEPCKVIRLDDYR